jgi:hypothetical protein
VHCPRCGIEQPQGDECIACGIIFTKYVESLGRGRATTPPKGASPTGSIPTKPDLNPVVQPFQQPTPEQPREFTAQAPVDYASPALDPFAVPTSSDAVPTLTDVDPFAQPQTMPTLTDVDPFAQPQTMPTLTDVDPFAQPKTVRGLAPVGVSLVSDPFAPPPSASTVETDASMGATVQMDPLTQETWESQLANAGAAKSGDLPGNVHDLATVPLGPYPVSSQATAPSSLSGDANYQALTSEDPFAPNPGPQQPPQQAETSSPERTRARPSQFQRNRPEEALSIHPVVAAARVLGAIACLAIAVLMMVNGRGLMSVMPYVIMVAYGCAALWGLTTYKGEITVRQFAIEMCVLVAVTLTLRTASPEMFSVDGGHDESPVHAIIKPHLPKNPLGRYTARALEVLSACEELANPLPTTDARRVEALVVLADTKSLIERYDLLPANEQSRVDGIEKRITVHGPTLIAAVLGHIEEHGPDSPFQLQGRKVHDAQRELSAALLRTQGLRARILVVPDGVTSESMPSSGQ